MSLLLVLGLPKAPASAVGAAGGVSTNQEAKKGEGAAKTEKREAPRPTPPLDFSLPLDLPEVSLSYVTAKGKISYVVTINPTDDEAAVDIKFKDLQPEVKVGYQREVQSKLAEKYGKKIKISDAMTLSKEGGVLGFDLDLEDTATKGQKMTVGFHILETNEKEHTIEWASFEVADTFPLMRRDMEIAGMRIGYVGHVDVKISFSPNWKKIGAYVLEKLGITIAEDAALGVAAGGTGTAGAVAVAAASSPVIVVAGGVVGGLALTAGVMALIANLESQGRDAAVMATDCAKLLWSYADSFGSTMRGQPGKNAQGNQDGEATLRQIMASAPGTTREQAIDAAKKSGQNFYELAYRQMLPKMRQAAVDAYDKVHPHADGNVLKSVLNQVMDLGSHYGSAPPVARSVAEEAKIKEDCEQAGPRFERARAIENDIKVAQRTGKRLGDVLERLYKASAKKAAASAYDEANDLYAAADAIVEHLTSCVTPPPNDQRPFDQIVAGVLDKGGRALDGYNKAIALLKKGIAQYPLDQVKAASGS